MKKRLCAALVLAIIAVVFCSVGAMAAEKKFSIKISSSQTEKAMMSRVDQMFADRLNEVSGGRLDVKVFPAGQLGIDDDVIEQAIQGVPVFVNTDAARMGTYVKEIGILMMAYFADSYEECAKIMDTPQFKQWEEELAKKHGIRVLSFKFYDGPRQFMTNVPVNKLADLKHLRVRTIGAEACIESLKALGATPISMAWGEVYNGIQSGALDACEAQNTSTFPSRIFEVCKYQGKTSHFQLMQAIICGEAFFQRLPADLQELVLKTADEVAAESIPIVKAEVQKCEDDMKKAGLTVNEPDLAEFKEAVKPAYEKLGFTKLREELYKQIGKTN